MNSNILVGFEQKLNTTMHHLREKTKWGNKSLSADDEQPATKQFCMMFQLSAYGSDYWVLPHAIENGNDFL